MLPSPHPPAAANPTIPFHIRCHCGHVNYTFDLPASLAPLKWSLCHCSDCRYSTGQLYGGSVFLPDTSDLPQLKPDLSKLTAYKTSSRSWHHFCPTCGAFALLSFAGGLEWQHGLLDYPANTPLTRDQIFVGPTLDGGASVWLPTLLGGQEFKRYLGAREGGQLDDELMERMNNALSPSSRAVKLPARCACGAVKFYITHPARSIPLSDDFDYTKARYKARVCVCNSCVRSTGSNAVAWASIPAANIFQADTTPFNTTIPALGHYISSEGVYRDFCKTCCAKVFLRKDSDVWDVAIGLFHDITVRVEGWFEWPSVLDHAEEGRQKEFVHALAEGLRKRAPPS